ncbi:MAG: oligosaccharide flippase family protein [Betaproteobacteria bacterium]|nr:oligosaccharide flippase family protein [Betaproteobacteria bacterium]
MSLSLRKSLLVSFSQSYVQMGLLFLSSLFIARLLTPAELGVFSVAMVLITIANTVRDFGVVNYLVQEPDLTDARIRAARTLAFLTAWGIALVIALIAHPAAVFYREPGVERVMHILCLNFLLLPFGSVTMAIMRRRMQFQRIAAIQVTSTTAHLALAVFLAWSGFSYTSLAWGAVAGNLLRLILILASGPRDLPSRLGLSGLRRVFSFGAFSGSASLLQEVARGLPDVVLGRLMGMAPVAYFSRATGLIDLFNRLIVQAVGYVALPHFSARLREGKEMTQHFLLAVTHLTGLGWPFFVFLSYSAAPVVLLLYGNQWGASVPLVSILCLAEMLLTPFCLLEQLLISHGRADHEMGRNVMVAGVRLAPLLLLPPYGLEAVALGLAAANAVLFAAFYLLLRRHLPMAFSRFLRAMLPSAGVALLVAGALEAVRLAAPVESVGLIGVLALNSTAALLAFLLGNALLRHPLHEELRGLLRRFCKH